MNMVVDATFRAAWVPATQDFGELALDDLSSVSARVGGTVDDGQEITGGVPPYTIEGIIFLGGPPAAGMSLFQTTTFVTGDTIQIQTGPATPSGDYAGTIRATVSDSTIPTQVITVDLIYSVVVANAAVNTGDLTAASLNPTHWWPLDDIINVAGLDEARDIGNGATKYPLLPGAGQTFETQGMQLHMPGPARGTPRSPAMWNSRNGATQWTGATGPAKTGWLTGGFSCWFFPTNAGTLTGEQTIISERWENNSGLWIGLGIENSTGQLFCELTWNNNPRYKQQTVAGSAFNFMEWNHFAAMQRADGNGIILYVNGVEVSSNTPNLSGSLTVDSWVDAVMQSDGTRQVSLMSLVGGQLCNGAIYQPLFFVNNPPTASEILALYNSVANSFSADAVDYYDEFRTSILEPNAKALRYWFEGLTATSSFGETTELGYISQLANSSRFSGSGIGTLPSLPNQLSPYPVTGYRADRATVYGTNNPTYFTATGQFRSEGDEENINSLLAWVKIEDISISTTERQFMGMGQGGLRQIAIGVEGDRFFCEVYINTQADSYRREVSALAPQSLRVEVGKYYLLAVTQPADGGGYRLYINGVEATGGDAVDTFVGAGGPDYWLSTMGGGSQWGLRVGGVGGSQSVNNWKPNELMAWYWADRAITAAQILATYNAGVPTPNSFAGYITANLTGRRHDYIFNQASGNIIDSGSAPENLDTLIGTALEYEKWGYQPADPGQVGIDFNFTSVAQSNTIAANFWGDDSSGSIILFGYFAATNDPGTYYFMSGLQSAASPPRNGAGIFWLPSSDRLGIFISAAAGNNYDQRFEVPDGLPINRALVIAFVQRSDGGGIRCFLNGTELTAAASTPLGTFDVDSWLDEVGDPTTFFVGNINFSAGDFTAASRMMRLFTTSVALTTQQVEDLNIAAGIDPYVFPDNIAAEIAALAPEHLWLTNEGAALPLIDTGTNTQSQQLDLAIIGVDPLRNQAGADFSIESIDWGNNAGNWSRIANNIRGGVTGTAVFFFKFNAVTAGGETFLSVDSANETDNLSFGFGARGVGAGAHFNHLACAMVDGGAFGNYRAIVADDDNTTLGISGDGLWHMLTFRQGGGGVEIWLDDAQLATTEFTGGTPPAAASWFENILAPTQTFMGNGRYSTTTENWGRLGGPAFVLRNDVITPAQIATLANLIV